MLERIVDSSMVKRIAGLEMNALLYSKVLPTDVFQRARVVSAGTPIYDISGDVLFYRVPIIKGRTLIGYTDIAANSAFSHPLLGVSYGWAWDEKSLLGQAISVARKQRKGIRFNQIRFVAYSYPKLAVQFLLNKTEVMMIEWASWKPVPEKRPRKLEEPVSNFERWSLIEETPQARHKENLKKLKERISHWEDICPPLHGPNRFRPEVLDVMKFKEFIRPIDIETETRELHYSQDDSDHFPCYELRGQLTNVWCVAASVQMILDFYRYNYQQTRIASDLGLGTLTNPNGLPYSQDNNVVTVLENLTSNALTANMNTSPNWSEFVNEIGENRPLISFIPGHSRTVAGYAFTKLWKWYFFRSLLVYDPWPPTTGVITRWENFDTQIYRRTFTAQLTLV